jgi:hypothetical protein
MCIIYLVTSFTVRGVSVADVSQMLAAAMLLLIYGFRKFSFVVPLYGITLMQNFLSLICGFKFETVSMIGCSQISIYSYVL